VRLPLDSDKGKTFDTRIIETVSQVLCLNKGFTPTGLEPSRTKTVPKPYVIGASGLTSSEKQIPRNC
jgi:hypothetical protein